MWIPSGSDLIDLVVGGGKGLGYEAGQVINLCGNSAGGKSFSAAEIIANASHKYGDKCKWVYDDCESGFTFNTKDLYGIEIIPEDPDEVIRSPTIEKCYTNILTFLEGLRDDEFGIYVVDSLDGLVSDEIEGMTEERMKAHKAGKDYDKGSYQGGKPKFLSSQFLPTIAREAEKKNCLIILVSQLRDNIGGGLYAPKDRVSNGRALLFYSHSRIWITKKQDIEYKEKTIGSVIHIETRKCRGPRPYRTCMVTLHYRRGLDNVGSNVDWFYDLRTPDRGDLKKKAVVEWDGIEYTRDGLIEFIEDNGLEGELTSRVIAKWNKEEEEAEEQVDGRKKRF